MPANPASARGRLLLVLAGSALLLWLLALLGLGGGVGEGTPAEPSPWVLPEHEASRERLQALEVYAEIGARPLFNPGRRPQPFVIDTGAAGKTSGPEFALSGVVITQSLNLVILTPGDGDEPVQVHLGEALPGRPGWQLHTLAPRHALFQTPEGPVRFDLRGVQDVVNPPAPASAAEAGRDERALNGVIHNQEHQARIEAVRRRVAERRAQQQDEPAVSSHSNP